MFLLSYIIIINLTAYFLYAYDKKCAINSTWRVPENTLLLFGFVLGAFIGMHLLHHKTRHKKFLFTIPLLLIIHTILLIFNL